MKRTSITFDFVEYIPRDLDEGTLYISTRFRTAVHNCACGCGNKVVTPLRPSDWKLLFDGDTVSLTPSIGNWQFACRSHYWVSHNQIRWAGAWTDTQIEKGRRRDQRDRERYIANRARNAGTDDHAPKPSTIEERASRNGRWQRLRARLHHPTRRTE